LGKRTALIGGELVAGYGALLRLSYAGTAWELIWTGAGAFGMAATQSNANVTLGQTFIGNRKAVFTANGTYTVPDGVTTLWLSGVGGGGGGGGGNALGSSTQGAGGGGGFSGNVAERTPVTVAPGDSITVTIGGGGAGGASAGSLGIGGTGATGGTTSAAIGATTLLSLTGGAGGTGATVYNTSYVFGGIGFAQGICLTGRDAANGTSGIVGYGGVGQGNPFGLGGSGGVNSVSGAGGGGGGGAGAGGGGGGGGAGGGNGGNGYLIVEW
jgi:hypothetical protein